MKTSHLLLLALTAGSAATVASAQPFVVNSFGATLLENLFIAPAVTNDYLDIDGDGNATRLNGLPDNLATPLPGASTPGFVPGNYYVHQYRAIGSVNGLQELLDWGGKRTTPPFGPYATTDQFTVGMRLDAAPTGRSNRTVFVSNGVGSGQWFNIANPAGVPFRSSTDGLFLAQPWTVNGSPSAGGVRNDVAPIDVASIWGVTQAGSPKWSRVPNTSGYGTSPEDSLAIGNGSGRLAAGASNRMVDLVEGFNLNNYNGGVDDAKTIFDTEFTFAPIPAYANYGTGLIEATYTDMQHMYVTGRRQNGENLMIITRDVGSGTHNGHMNSFRIDPSWGTGENVGQLNTQVEHQQLGALFIPGNKGGSGALENTLRNVRLGISYSGGERWRNNNIFQVAEIIGLRNDLNGRTAGDFARPTMDRLVNNGLTGEIDPSTGVAYTRDGYRIGGRAVVATVGDPLQTSAANGGYGFIAGETNPGTPAMENVHAAKFVNNLSRSTAAFNALPGSDDTVFSPGEFVAARFIPLNATDYVQTLTDGTVFAPSTILNQTLQNFQLSNAISTFVTNNASYATPYVADASRNGRNPTRFGSDSLATTTVYSDGTAAVASGDPAFGFLADDGTTRLTYNTAGNTRNRIAGDFDGNGLRNVNDAEWLVRAWIERNGGANITLPSFTGANPGTGTAGSLASFEILGDFTADGNFGRRQNGGTPASPIWIADRDDARYFADGLAIAVSGPNAGKLDRKAGFTAIDNAWLAFGAGSGAFAGANFFGTTKATGTAYAAGDSRGDIVGTGTNVPGYLPMHSNGVIDAADVNYVSTQIRLAADRSVEWSNLDEAQSADLSADINGDLVINCDDVTELVVVILGTDIKDLNLDGSVTDADKMIAEGNVGVANATWGQGDVNCDGVVDAADVALFGGGLPACGSIDFNGDGLFPDDSDLIEFLTVLAGGDCTTGTCGSIDFNGDGLFPDDNDLVDFLTVLAGGTPTSCTP
jgi:hypothetical protein